MSNRVKSSGPTIRLSVTWKCAQERRKYPTSSATRGMSSCCTPAENSQLAWRRLKPEISRSSKASPGTEVPKLVSSIGPHSPLVAGLRKLHCGI